jgi:hypothetical protein
MAVVQTGSRFRMSGLKLSERRGLAHMIPRHQSLDGDEAKRLGRLAKEWQQSAEFDGLGEVMIKIARCGAFGKHVG